MSLAPTPAAAGAAPPHSSRAPRGTLQIDSTHPNREPLIEIVPEKAAELDILMNVPNKITVQVVSDDEIDLSDIIVQMVVSTGQKNPYPIYFPKTDTAGTATLTRKDFVGQFEDHWESGLMDHAGTLASADPLVRVSLYDPSWSIANRNLALAWPLLKHERTKWPPREEEYQWRVSSRNRDFIAAPMTVDLHRTNVIVLPIIRKRTRR